MVFTVDKKEPSGLQVEKPCINLSVRWQVNKDQIYPQTWKDDDFILGNCEELNCEEALRLCLSSEAL